MQKPRVRTPAWIAALRPHHSIKNILIFVPLLVGHAFGDVEKIVAAGLGFFILCLLTSASYLINDIADLDADRRHPLKRRRPFASGRLTATFGKVAAPIMIVGAIAAAYALAPRFAATLLAYLALTIAYSFSLKRLPLLDVFIVSGVFTLRIVLGTEVIGLEHSPCLLSLSAAFFLSLAFAKRHAELVRAAFAKTAEIAGRGYRSDDWPLTLTFGIGGA